MPDGAYDAIECLRSEWEAGKATFGCIARVMLLLLLFCFGFGKILFGALTKECKAGRVLKSAPVP